MKINNLNSDKPRERLINSGAAALADYELLAILLGFGGKGSNVLDLSQKLLNTYGGLQGLTNLNVTQLLSNKFIGLSKATQILALTELALRITFKNTKSKVQIQSPQDVYNLVIKDMFNQKRERLYLLSLDSRNYLIEKDLISIGTINETMVSPREIFRQALLRNAVSIILVHNHPSTIVNPSDEDIILTNNIYMAGLSIGIKLLDHVICSDHNFSSLKSLNLINLNMKGGEK